MEKIDFNTDFQANYCIPLWQRDEHVRYSLKRVQKRLPIYSELHKEPIALAGFGPSLRDTWEQLRNFEYVISCSGSHKFLIERGIIPTWHVEVDPRPHKIQLLGPPHPKVKYLIASCCNPAFFDHLEGFDVTIWHVYDPSDDGVRLVPPGDIAVTGGCDVGLRSIAMAAYLGFRDLHIFGIDGCQKDARHAAAHPNEKTQAGITEYDGREFVTTPGLLLAARQVFHELDMMPVVTAKFYGDGLVQCMAQDYVRKEGKHRTENVIAATRPEIISAEHLERNRRLHVENKDFGSFAAKHASMVVHYSEIFEARTVLDYGCGKGSLARALPFPIWEYDPAVPGKQESPKKAELVCCFDVLEHVEPDKLGFVLADLQRCTKRAGYFIVNTAPAIKRYHDGLNTHLIQQGEKFWREAIGKFFKILFVEVTGAEIHFVVASPFSDMKIVLQTDEPKAEEPAHATA